MKTWQYFESIRDNFYLDYQMEEEIGSGAFGRAIKSKRRSDQEIVVVKELIGRKMTQKEIQEVCIHYYTSHYCCSFTVNRQRTK